MKEKSRRRGVFISESIFWEMDRLISAYRRLIISCVSATSRYDACARISGSPANCPALVTFVIEISSASSGDKPSATAFMPNVNATDK